MINSLQAVPEKEKENLNLVNSTYFLDKNNTLASNSSSNSHKNSTVDIVPLVDPYLLEFSLKDILLFSAVISASDSIAALAFINEKQDPKLFSILFGEGVVNDAVCIVIYKIMKDFIDSGEGK